VAQKLEMVEPGPRSVTAQHARICLIARNPSLEAAFGRQDLEVIFSKVPCKKSRLDAKRNSGFWRNGIYDQIREVMSLQVV